MGRFENVAQSVPQFVCSLTWTSDKEGLGWKDMAQNNLRVVVKIVAQNDRDSDPPQIDKHPNERTVAVSNPCGVCFVNPTVRYF